MRFSIRLGETCCAEFVTRRDVYAPDAKLYVIESAGPREVARSPVAFFWGALESDAATQVVVSLDPDTGRIGSFARTAEGWTELRPLDAAGSAPDYLLASSAAFVEPATGRLPFTCGEEELPKMPARPGSATSPESIAALRQATIAVDTDNEFMNLKFANNVTNATNYVAQLVALMSVLYERDLEVRLLQGTTFYRVSTTPDPYAQSGTGNADGPKLDEFADYWSANYASVSRALAMLLSGKQSSANSASGIASVDALCSESRGYSFSQVFKFSGSTAASDRDLVGHEVGHNFGSDHTHCYVPPIDMCYGGESGCYSGATSCPAAQTINGVTNVRGTIMSYCDNLSGCAASGVFHPRTVTLLSPIIAAHSACVFPVATSNPKEASPLHDMTAQRGAGAAVSVTYTPACGATQHTVYTGNLSTLGAGGLVWSQRTCSLGTAGILTFTPAGNVYFVVAGNNGTNEGSYGQMSSGERPAAGGGTPCAMHDSVSAGSPAHAHTTGGSDAGDEGRHPSPSGPCVSITGCTVIAPPTLRGDVLDVVLHRSPDIAAPGCLRSRPATAPELPPPRA